MVGIKPTLGLVSRTGIVPISAAQDTAGPMTRTVADAAVLAGRDGRAGPGGPRYRSRQGHATDYATFLDPAALDGARLGVWRAGSTPADAATVAVLETRSPSCAAQGAQIIDPVELADWTRWANRSSLPSPTSSSTTSMPTWPGLGGDHPADLAGLIEFNNRNAAEVLNHFGQELFEQAEATSGDLSEASYREARSSGQPDRPRRAGRGAARISTSTRWSR